MPASRRKYWSGRPDLNRRPPAPKAGALPGCATPRHVRHPILAQLARLSSWAIGLVVPKLCENSIDYGILAQMSRESDHSKLLKTRRATGGTERLER